MLKIPSILILFICSSAFAQEFQYKTACPSWVVMHDGNRVCLNEKIYLKEFSRKLAIFNRSGGVGNIVFNFSGEYSFDDKKFKDDCDLLEVEKKYEKTIRYFRFKPSILPPEYSAYFAIFVVAGDVEVVVSSYSMSSLKDFLSELEELHKL